MAIYKSGKFWRADVYIHAKRALQKGGFLTKKDAKTWHDMMILNPVLEPAPQEPVPQKPIQPVLFESVIQRFEEYHLPKIAINTKRRYEIDISLRIRPILGAIPVEEFTPLFLEEVMKEVYRTLSLKTANNCIGLLKTILNQGARWRMVESGLSDFIRMKKSYGRPYSWWENKEDILKFLSVAQFDPYYLAYRLGLECGMRLGEIVGLTKSAIDLQNLHIHVHQQWLENEQMYAPPKHGKSRYIRFERDSELYELLEKAVHANPGEERLFLSKSGDRILGCKMLSQRYFQRLIVKSGVPRIRFHDLRHTFASWYMLMSDNIWELKGILGHADIQTTQKYAHLSKGGQGVPQIFQLKT